MSNNEKERKNRKQGSKEKSEKDHNSNQPQHRSNTVDSNSHRPHSTNAAPSTEANHAAPTPTDEQPLSRPSSSVSRRPFSIEVSSVCFVTSGNFGD
ncbi:hypothetical protein RYX36_027871 [Vicia faba]